MPACVPSRRSKQTNTKRTHTHTYTLSLHCRHNSQAWLCASLIPLTVSERHVNQRRRLPAQPYMSLSFLLSLLLSPSLCFYLHLLSPICLRSCQSPFLHLIPHCIYLAFLSFASCSCSSSHPITANHVLLFAPTF